MAEDVAQSAGEHAHLAVERRHAAERPGVMLLDRLFLDERIALALLLDEGERRERRQRGGEDHRAGAGSAAAMRSGEGLVEVDVHRVDAEVARADAADDGVEVRAVAIRSEEHTSELQSLMRISYAVFCLKKKKQK